MIERIRKTAEKVCKKETNYFGYGAWTYHIVSVVKYAKFLAQKLKADEEIVEIAALLHDYACGVDENLYTEHHIHGARLAEELLKEFDYPIEKIERVKSCILSHRASKNIPKESIEAEIVASADSLSHFDNVHSLLYLAFVKHKMGVSEGTKWVLDKLERSWNRLTLPEAKEMIREKYKSIKNALESNNLDNS